MKKTDPASALISQVSERLGKDRLAKLATQPMCIAREGGMNDVLQAACDECAGYENPVLSAAVRVLQLCGSVPTADDLKI